MSFFAIILKICLVTQFSLAASPRVTAQLSPEPKVERGKVVSVITKPRFRKANYYDREDGPRPHGGSIRNERRETWLEFEYEGQTYSQLWSAKGWSKRVTPPPIELADDTTYKFLLRLEEGPDSKRCSVLEIWLGRRLLWSKDKQAGG